MIGVLLASLLGAGILWSLLGDEDEETDDTVIEHDPTTISGSQGDDVVDPDDPRWSDENGQFVDLQSGNDQATVTTPFDSVLDGGPGDDELTSTAVGNLLRGGDGDDTLAGVASTTIRGGDGDDLITVDLTTELNTGFAPVNGNAGDDQLIIKTVIGNNVPDFSSVTAAGGQGADTFEVLLNISSEPVFDSSDVPLRSPSGVTLDDFNPAEDILVIDITNDANSEGRDLIDTELVPDAQGHTDLVLTFAANDIYPQTVTTIGLGISPGISLNDIALIQT